MASLGMVRVLDLIASILILAIGFILIQEMSNFRFYIVGISIFDLLTIILVIFMSWSHKNFSLITRVPG